MDEQIRKDWSWTLKRLTKTSRLIEYHPTPIPMNFDAGSWSPPVFGLMMLNRRHFNEDKLAGNRLHPSTDTVPRSIATYLWFTDPWRMCPTCFHLGAVRNSSQEDVKLFLFLRATQFCDGIILKDIILPAIFCVIKLRKCRSHTYAPLFGSTYNIYIYTYGCSRVYKYIHIHSTTHVQKRAPFAGMLRARPAWIVAPVVPWWKEKRTGSLSSSG